MINKDSLMNFSKKIKDMNRIPIHVLEIHIVDHCNLKCKACSHFSNIADEFFISPEEFTNSLDIAKKRFKIYSFALMGGEPLLHPQLGELVTIARKKLPNTEIGLTTNGLLIDAISDNLWAKFIENNVKINISKYPVNSDNIAHLLDKVAEKNLLGRVYVKNYFRKYINLKGNSNRHLTYSQCYMNHCLIVKGDCLFKCPFSLYVGYFNKKFNTKIPVSSGLNLKTASNRQIKEFIGNPIESCDYCSFLTDEKAHFKWELSEGYMEEWCVDTVK